MKKVLIVDDEKSFLLSLKDGLSIHSDKYQVLTAENGREAVAVLRALPIDLLVTDLKLPEMDGFELLAWVSRNQPQMPVIVMTAFGTPEIEARLSKMDTLQYLEKPLDLEILQQGIINGLKSGTKSYIRGITLSTFLQLMNVEKKNCTLKVSSDGQVGYLYIRRGDLIDAEFGELGSEAAALEIVGWDNAEIEMDNICRRQHVLIKLSLEHILIEAFRRKDELAHEEKTGERIQSSPSKQTVKGSTEKVFPGEVGNDQRKPGARPLSPDALARKRLLEVLTKLAAVKEYAVFDKNSFLEEKNTGGCSFEEFDPAIFTHLVDMVDAQLSFGSFNYMTFNTGNRDRFLLFRSQQHRVLAKLKPGTQPKLVIKEIKRYVNR